MDEEKGFCRNCGSLLPPDQPFCSQCGTKAGEAGAGAATTPLQTPVQPPPAYPYYGPAAPHAKTEGLAVVSLVIAIASFFLFPFIGSAVAIILGYVARDRIKRAAGGLEGESLARAGIIIGFVVLAIHLAVAIIALIALLALHPWRDVILLGGFLGLL